MIVILQFPNILSQNITSNGKNCAEPFFDSFIIPYLTIAGRRKSSRKKTKRMSLHEESPIPIPKLCRTKPGVTTHYQRRLEKIYLEGGDKAVAEYRKMEALRSAVARAKMTEEQIEKYNEKGRIRQANYR